MNKGRRFFRFVTIIAILVAGTFFSSCSTNSGDGHTLYGTITYDAHAGDAIYVHLLDEDNPNIEYESFMHQIINITEDVSSVEYSIDTSDAPAGTYYLLAGYDTASTDNMDWFDPAVWEAKAWYGGSVDGSGPHPPSSPNITNLSGQYDIVLVGLP